jgi:lipoprotein NlpI
MRVPVLRVGAAAFFVVAGSALVSQAIADDSAACEKASGDEAIAACTRVIQNRRTSTQSRATSYHNRGLAYAAKGDHDRAIADYSEAIRLVPKDADAHFDRGLAYLNSGDPAKALADVGRASELDPRDAYHALWVEIIGHRNNVASRLPRAIAKIDMKAWPAPVIRLFLGQMTPAAVLAAADDPDARKKTNQVCEANFYSGEYALRADAKDEATRLFRLAASDCPRGFIEWSAANAELKALGVAQ